jgi:hypothetical protein
VGEIPTRSRHCDWGATLISPLAAWGATEIITCREGLLGRLREAKIHKSGDLPGCETFNTLRGKE